MKRLITFLESKIVTPPLKTLVLSPPTVMSTLPTPRPLSISTPVLTDLPPKTPECHLPPATRSTIPYSNRLIMDFSRPFNFSISNVPLFDGRIPQLDGGSQNVPPNNMDQSPHPPPALDTPPLAASAQIGRTSPYLTLPLH